MEMSSNRLSAWILESITPQLLLRLGLLLSSPLPRHRSMGAVRAARETQELSHNWNLSAEAQQFSPLKGRAGSGLVYCSHKWVNWIATGLFQEICSFGRWGERADF